MPWKRPLEAPNVASVFPQVRQMVLDGKNREAMALAVQHMNDGPIKQDTEPHLTVPAFLMQLDFPKAAPVKDYLRTVNFENSEIKVAWTDEHGDWLRQTFTSRPDNVVVQWLTATTGQPVNVRISLHRSAEWSMRSGMDWGSHSGIGSTAPDRGAFTPGASGSPPPVSANAAVGRLTIGRTQRGIPAKLPHKRAACLAYTYARMQAVLPMNRVAIHFYVAPSKRGVRHESGSGG